MSRIEELPDDFNASLDLNSSNAPLSPSQAPPSQKPAQGITAAMLNSMSPFPPKPNSTTPESTNPSAPMPPAMANTKQYSTDELLAELNRTPLFMTSLDSEDNVDLEALKALAYEGTKAEVAGNFREQGNECAKLKQWKDAREYYDKAIAVCKHGVPKAEALEDGPADMDLKNKKDAIADADGAVANGEEEVVDEEAERKKEKAIEEASYVNRALCNLELRRSIFPQISISLRNTTHTDEVLAQNRKLRLMHPRLRCRSHAQPPKHQSSLPDIASTLRTPKARPSKRSMQPSPLHRPVQRRRPSTSQAHHHLHHGLRKRQTSTRSPRSKSSSRESNTNKSHSRSRLECQDVQLSTRGCTGCHDQIGRCE